MKRKCEGKVSLVIILLIVSIAFLQSMIISYVTQKEIVVTITKTDRIVERSGEDISSKYLVYTEEETFENTDSWMHFKFNSSDVQGRLLEGKKYVVKVYGWRIPFFSCYRNIIKIVEKL